MTASSVIPQVPKAFIEISSLRAHLMSDLVQRLQKVQRPEKPVLIDISHFTREELATKTIQFGSTHVGRSFQHMWDMEQEWVTWFLKRFSKSPKLDHRLFVRFVELQVQLFEDWGATVPLTSEKAQTQSKQVETTPPSSSMAMPKAKTQAAPAKGYVTKIPEFVNTSPDQEEEFEFLQAEWEANESIEQFNNSSQADVQSLQTRMLNLENALQQVITHLQKQSVPEASKPESQ